MIAMVPEIYPDELVFSFCSRYHQRMGYRSRESTGRDLFENAMTKPAIDFPSRLKILADTYAFGTWIPVTASSSATRYFRFINHSFHQTVLARSELTWKSHAAALFTAGSECLLTA